MVEYYNNYNVGGFATDSQTALLILIIENDEMIREEMKVWVDASSTL